MLNIPDNGLCYANNLSRGWITDLFLIKDSVKLPAMPNFDLAISYWLDVDPEGLASELSSNCLLCCRQDPITRFEWISLLSWSVNNGSTGGMISQSQQPGVFQWA